MADIHDPARRELIEAYIADWQQRLSLGNWDIRLSAYEPGSADSIAEAAIWDVKNVVLVSVCAAEPESEVEHSVIHELLHVGLHPMDRLYSEAISEMGHQAGKIAEREYNLATEQFIGHVQRAFMGRTEALWMEDNQAIREAWPLRG